MISELQAPHPAACLCARAAERPAPARSLPELLAAAPEARILEADAATLALILPHFEQAAAVTAGPYALMSEFGGYARPRLAGQPLRPPSARIELRLAPTGREILALAPADPERRLPAALHLFDACGAALHRAELAHPEDLLSLTALGAEALAGAPPAPAERAPSLPSLPAIRQARALWWEAEPCRHLDDLLIDGGRARAHCLPHVGAEAARRIDPRVLDHLLAHLARRRTSFLRGAVRPGAMQLHAGPLEALAPEGGLLRMRSGASLMALDLEGVAACWLTRCGRGWMQSSSLELYDAQGFAVALFGVQPEADLVQRVDWERLAASLPDAPARPRR